MRKTGAFFLLVCGSLASAVAAAQDEDSRRLTVASLQQQDSKLRVTLEGRTGASNGATLVLHVVPIAYRLADDGRTLVAAPREVGALSCLGEVRDRRLTARFTAERGGEYEVQIETRAASTERTMPVQRILLFDPAWVLSRQLDEIRQFFAHLKTVKEFFAELEPYAKAGERIPVSLLRRLEKISDPLLLWAETSEFSAASAVLVEALRDLGSRAPWDVEQPSPIELEGYRYPTRQQPDPRAFDVGPLRAKIALARETAFREALLGAVVGFEHCVATACGRAEGGRARAAATAKRLRGHLSSLLSGELADPGDGRVSTEELEGLATDEEEVLRGLPRSGRALEEDALEGLGKLSGRLKSIRQVLEKGEQPKGEQP